MSRCFAIKTLHTESFDQSDLTALKWLSLQDQSRSYLSQTQTIDLGSLKLEDGDIININKAKSKEELFEGLKIVQTKECMHKTSGKRRHSSSTLKIRRNQSMDLDDQIYEMEHKPKMIRLQSEADLLSQPWLKALENGEQNIADFYLKVPVNTC